MGSSALDLSVCISGISGGGGSGDGKSIRQSITQLSHGFTTGDVVYFDAGTATYKKAKADSATTSAVIGVVETASTDIFTVVYQGYINLSGISGVSITGGSTYYLSDSTAGKLTPTAPLSTSGSVILPLFVATSSTLGIVVNSLQADPNTVTLYTPVGTLS